MLRTALEEMACRYDPDVEAALPYSGAPLTYDGSIPAAFGMDFIEIRLDRSLAGQPPTAKPKSK